MFSVTGLYCILAGTDERAQFAVTHSRDSGLVCAFSTRFGIDVLSLWNPYDCQWEVATSNASGRMGSHHS